MTDTWTVTLPITRPLSLNDRTHWRARAVQVQQLRNATHALIRAAGVPPLPRVVLELHYAPRDKRRRDALNLVATLKVAEDATVDAGVIPDDTAEFSVPTMPVLDPPTGKTGRLYLVIREAT
ncbi:MAG: hypothetical protein ACXV5Q_00800 [Frankiaceae bacterium]